MSSLGTIRPATDAVNSSFYPCLTIASLAAVASRQVPTSGAEGPFIAFGQWIREQREAAGLTSQPRAEIRARAKGLTLINQGKLSHIERGQNGNPDPDAPDRRRRP